MTETDKKATTHKSLLAAAVFMSLLTVYHVNGGFLYGNDAKASLYLPVSVIEEGNLSFRPVEVPSMFVWDIRGARGVTTTSIRSWDMVVSGKPMSFWRDAGKITFNREQYFLVPSIHAGYYVNTFGIGPGILALPAFTVLHATVDNLAENPKALWYGGKFVAAMTVAVSGAFIFLTAAGFVKFRYAVFLALVYGLGTCVWSTSSQALWQHGPNEMFLAMGVYFLSRIGISRRNAIWCGLAVSAAFVCRPTSILVLAAIGIYLLVTDRKAMVAFVLACLPLMLMMAVYNDYYLGSPFTFGQSKVSASTAEIKTGSSEMWQTPLPTGLAGLLISPSRGLFVYSPFFAFAIWGGITVWRDRRYYALRPITIAILAILCLEAKHFDWWSGWSFGYRHIVDLSPLLAVLLVPVVASIFRKRRLAALLLVMVAWAVMVQFLGAFAYTLSGWNARTVPGEKAVLDIDRPEHRHRLWSVGDSQIFYYLTHFREARQRKSAMMKLWLQ